MSKTKAPTIEKPKVPNEEKEQVRARRAAGEKVARDSGSAFAMGRERLVMHYQDQAASRHA